MQLESDTGLTTTGDRVQPAPDGGQQGDAATAATNEPAASTAETTAHTRKAQRRKQVDKSKTDKAKEDSKQEIVLPFSQEGEGNIKDDSEGDKAKDAVVIDPANPSE